VAAASVAIAYNAGPL